MRHVPTLQDSAIEHADCPICYNNLCDDAIAIFLNGRGYRVCRHMFCKSCANKWIGKNKVSQCPLCRKKFAMVEAYRFGKDDCFDLFDIDDSGDLTREEMVLALNALLPYSENVIIGFVESHWNEWDVDGNGLIDETEFKQIVFAVQEELKLTKHVVPDVDSGDAWFRHWDSDGNGELDIHELTLALIHTLNLEGDANNERRDEFIEMVGIVIAILDPDGDGTITKKEWPEFRNNLQANLEMCK